MNKKIIFTVLAFLLFAQNIFADDLNLKNIDFNKTDNSSLILKTYPQNPKSNEETTVVLSSYDFNINFAEVVVYVNNKEYKRGRGLKEFKFKTAYAGENNDIKVIVKDENGKKVYSKIINFTSEDVGLVYEVNNAYIPFGYKGKATALSNSDITVYAITDFKNSKGKKIDKKSLIYTWSVNGTVVNSDSGFGKYKYNIKKLTSYPGDMTLSVKVTDITKRKFATNEIYFQPQSNIETDFYVVNSDLPFNFKNVSSDGILKTNKNDFVLWAIPYFLNISNKNVISWKVNGKRYQHKNNEDYFKINLVNNSKQDKINASISLDIIDSSRLFQSISESLKVIVNSKGENSMLNNNYFNKGKNSEDSGFFGT